MRQLQRGQLFGGIERATQIDRLYAPSPDNERVDLQIDQPFAEIESEPT
jgi:hypothetical protein